jgi:hypothetical protein
MPTANMGLTLPTDHGSADVWDTILDAVFALIDAHDHTAGKGVQVPSAALKINADVSWSFGGTPYAISDAKAIDFAAVAVGTVAGLAGALFVNSADNELYYRTIAGANVKFTNGAALNFAAFVGGIGGDYSAVGALEDFDDASHTYRFRQQVGAAVRQFGKMSSADVQLFEFKANPAAGVPANSVNLKSPTALAASYNAVWFAALPASQVLVQIDNAGQMFASNTLAANANIVISGTALYKRGVTRLQIPFLWNVFDSSGVPTHVAGTPGITLPQNVNAFFPLLGLSQHERITGFEVNLAAAPTGNITYEIYQQAGGAYSATGAAVTTNSATPVFAGNFTPVTNCSYYLRVSTPNVAANTVTVCNVTIINDVP